LTDPGIKSRETRLSPARLVPIAVLLAALAAAFLLNLHHYLSLESLKENRDALLAWRAAHPVLSALVLVLVYCVSTATSVPGAVFLTLAAGYLFGTFLGGVLVVIGATAGAAVIFLAARYAFADYFERRAGDAVRRMEAGFRKNATYYMLFLRLVPVFPFWLVNLVPALLNVRLGVFMATTMVGIVPGTLVYTSLGNGIGAVIDAGGTPNLRVIFDPQVFVPLLLLAILSLVPVAYRRFKARREMH
jgi:uncharacterized membrane protein YdjX (TVP38/TMEM64 family)